MSEEPDHAINASPRKGITTMPNEVLLNPRLSAQAKVVHAILLADEQQEIDLQSDGGFAQYTGQSNEEIDAALEELDWWGYITLQSGS